MGRMCCSPGPRPTAATSIIAAVTMSGNSQAGP